ncbi:hypothetical protein [Flavilitoribacter nigricans]|uniref:Uncharacterized protein n=1 Tax=Flavilitoribacter nigricans (strain ATCC 23147 / DSM 23189 / NBRC 102662 / NCIMB 1420 / SS-2) TaxID=1122177 RepID=A0A2D0MYE9_FLAN2|nr:hypothetical protein [Flavilitoribacter nigricans]PHN01294.1 hypothetical protein CRP01_37665 [Flavilitoribacter nigricans DSM 23189 = NBRC 102662]
MTLSRFQVICFCVILGAIFLLPGALGAQRVDLSDDFNQLLTEVDAQLVLPVEADYKDIRPLKNRWMDYDFSIRSRKEKMEIRYKILPFEVENRTFYAPHVKAMQVMMQVASNQEDAIVSTISLSEKSLKEDFRADWGKLFTFTPKEEFSNKQTCQLITLFREGKGMVFLFFLFNKPPMELTYRHLAVSFGETDL